MHFELVSEITGVVTIAVGLPREADEHWGAGPGECV